jgi:hypothetical protein
MPTWFTYLGLQPEHVKTWIMEPGKTWAIIAAVLLEKHKFAMLYLLELNSRLAERDTELTGSSDCNWSQWEPGDDSSKLPRRRRVRASWKTGRKNVFMTHCQRTTGKVINHLFLLSKNMRCAKKLFQRKMSSRRFPWDKTGTNGQGMSRAPRKKLSGSTKLGETNNGDPPWWG